MTRPCPILHNNKRKRRRICITVSPKKMPARYLRTAIWIDMTTSGENRRTDAPLEWAGSGSEADERLWPYLYDELRSLADRCLRGNLKDFTLQPTALVHETFLRLVGHAPKEPQELSVFFATAARSMRHIITDHARRRRAAKRGGGAKRIPLTAVAPFAADYDHYLVQLDDALTELTDRDPELGQVVELRFFGGFTIAEIAELLNVAPITVNRRWKMARGWLHRELTGDG